MKIDEEALSQLNQTRLSNFQIEMEEDIFDISIKIEDLEIEVFLFSLLYVYI